MTLKNLAGLVLGATTLIGGLAHAADDVAVKITRDLAGVDVVHEGKTVRIERNQDRSNLIDPMFGLTSRKCPPFCIQPFTLSEGIETIGEIEMLDYLKRVSEGDDSVLVIDSRGGYWVRRGTIPGSINIHWRRLHLKSATEEEVADILQNTFGVMRSEKFWDFRTAKTLVLFCNGMWCGQSPTNIRSLLRFGYPPKKIKWYRGGMQNWNSLGLTTVKP